MRNVDLLQHLDSKWFSSLIACIYDLSKIVKHYFELFLTSLTLEIQIHVLF